MKALLLENIHPAASAALTRAGYEVDTRGESLGEAELIDALDGVSLLGIRSNTRVTDAALAEARDLIALGCFCIGTNQVDLSAASRRGIAVFNAPYSNSRSVVELVMCEIIALARRLVDKTTRMHDGVWDKSARGSHEIRGRTLGIVGYGNIGTQLGNMAEALGMRVAFFDIADRPAHGNASRMDSLADLLATADVVSIHVDGRPGNAGLFGEREFDMMKPRALFINASRGMVVDDVVLRERILAGQIAGAALDVFPVEPKAQGDTFDSVLRGLDNVILTPHVAASTQEAQEDIGRFVGDKIVDFVSRGTTGLSVNLPEVRPAESNPAFRMAYLHENVPGVLSGLNQVLAAHHDNVVAQHLATRGSFGYVVTDTESPLPATALEELRNSAHTISLRTWPA